MPDSLPDVQKSPLSPSQAQARELKHELKRWEAEFGRTQGRAPTKDDLLQLPEMAEKYRLYSRFKKKVQREGMLADSRKSPNGRIMLPLETSVLSKRKTASGRNTAPLDSTPSRSNPQLGLFTPDHNPGSRPSESDDAIEGTPKRPRISNMSVSPEHSGGSDSVDRTCKPALSGAVKVSIGEIGYPANDAVTYTPPPSLIRRYNQHTPSTKATEQPATSSLLSAMTTLSTSAEATTGQGTIDTAKSARSIDLAGKAPMFKARAGKLVKTTSIPLSAFGASFGGASQLLSSQGHLSDGNDTSAPSQTLAELSSGDLVFGENEEYAAEPKPIKKPTQKRSTRRAKLKPVNKDGTVDKPVRSRPSDPQLVSQNFYKIKGQRRGPRSTDDRRLAMYKRMVSRKQRPAGASASSKAKCSQQRQSAPNPYYEDNDSSKEDIEDDYMADIKLESSKSTHVGRRRTVLGHPLYYFAADSSTDDSELCTVDMDAESPQVSANSQLKLDLRKVLQHVWHFDRFRAGQAAAIRQAIEGRPTLLSLATGAGKSLAYQLPALVLWAAYGTLTLVVTPLLSLMRDQMQQLPPGMLALSMSSEKELQSDIATQLLSGKVQLLFVSPERLQSRRFQEMMASDGMPRVRLAVVDEAHCADEWSHSFRPAYLQLARQLQRLGSQCVLAMTGTATATLTRRLCEMFNIDPEGGVVRGSIVRENIELSVVPVDVGSQLRGRSTAREDALVELLRTPDMAQLGSIIVYVTTQASADRIAEYLTVRSLPAQSYHAGKSAAERARIQAAFMHKPDAGALAIRVLVATVAFGMGLNKHDVRAVVHFNLPRSMEAYVQETGRAGRDGGPARGVLLLATQSDAPGRSSTDAMHLRSWTHAVGVDAVAIRRLLRRLFPAEFMQQALAAAQQAHTNDTEVGADLWRVSHTAAVELADLEADADVDQATALTLIGYLAIMEPEMVQMLPNTHRRCAIRFTRTNLGKLAETHRLFAQIAQLNNGPDPAPSSSLKLRFSGAKRMPTMVEVDIFELARRLESDPADVVTELYQWRGRREVVLDWQAPSCVVHVTLDTSRFVDTSLDPEAWSECLAQRIDDHITTLADRVGQQNEAQVRDGIFRVNAIESAMLAACTAAHHVHQRISDAAAAHKAARKLQNRILQAAVETYFAASEAARERAICSLKTHTDVIGEVIEDLQAKLYKCPTTISAPAAADAVSDATRNQIRDFVHQHAGEFRSARAIARVFHGLSGPSSRPSQWMWCPEWGSLVATDFDAVLQCAQEELVQLRCGHTVE